MRLIIAREAEDLILNEWLAGTSVVAIEQMLKVRSQRLRLEHGCERAFSDSDVRNVVSRARQRGDKRAVSRAKYAVRVNNS